MPGTGFGHGYQLPNQAQYPPMMGWNASMPSLPEGELEKMMIGNIHPAKIYQAIPCDSVLYPVVETTDKGGRLEWDLTNNEFTVADSSGAHIREKNLKRLVKTLDSPIEFAHAWSWFVCLTNYRYHDPGFHSAMNRFGRKVVAYSITTAWDIVLRVFVELATPILTGNLAANKNAFDSAMFAEALGPYRSTGAVQNASTMSNIVANPGTISDAASQPKANAAHAGLRSNKPICRRWNKGECDDVACSYRHVCSQCKQEHPQVLCPLPTTSYANSFGAPYAGYALQPNFQPQHNFNQAQQNFSGNQGFVPNQPRLQRPTGIYGT